MKQKAWVIVAGTGAYSDRHTWPARVFINQAEAQREMAILENLSKVSINLVPWRDKDAYYKWEEAIRKAQKAYHEMGYEDYSGSVDWELCEAELISK